MLDEYVGALDHIAHGGKALVAISIMVVIILILGFLVFKIIQLGVKLYARPMYDNIVKMVGLAPVLNEIVVTNKEFTHKVNNLATQVQGFSDRLNNHEEDVWKEINSIRDRTTVIETKIGMK